MNDLFYRLGKLLSNRMLLLFMVLCLSFLLIWAALYKTQVLNHEYYAEQQINDLYDETSVGAERGNIYDRYGRPLAINEEENALYYTPDSNNPDLIEAIRYILEVLSENGEKVTLEVEFPINYEEGRGYYFVDGFTRTDNVIAHNNFLAEVYNTSRDELTDEQKDTNATTCMQILCEDQFGMTLGDDPEADLQIAVIRYAIFSGRFDPSEPVLIASSVSSATEVRILERSEMCSGFSVEKTYSRVYPEGELFAHVIGYVGRINEEELAAKEEEGLDYSRRDLIGKTGLEAAYESTLRGENGVTRVEVDATTGEKVGEYTLTSATQGNNIFLTIDRDVQESTYNALVEQIKSLLISKITEEEPDTEEEDIDVNDATYSVSDVLYALVDNHFVSSSLLESGVGTYLDSFRKAAEEAKEASCDELYDLIINSRTPVMEFESWEKDLYDMMIESMRDNIHLSYDYQQDEDFYPDYLAGKVAPYDFFVYCIQNDYLDMSLYRTDKDTDVDTLVRSIVRTELEALKEDSEFTFFVYSYLLSTEAYSQKDFMLMLYEQNLISDSDGSREELLAGDIEVIDLLKWKIQNDEITPADINLDPCSGSAVVTDPDSGEVLAIVSYPSFDPNLFMNDTTYYYEVIQDKSGPLTFRATEELRAIGSTFKMATAITGLSLGVIDETTQIYDDLSFPYSNAETEPYCWSSISHGLINVRQALDYSCNYFFYQVGFLLCNPKPATDEDPPFGALSTRTSKYNFDDSVGLAKLKVYTDLLGLSTKTGIEIAESTPHASELDAVRSAIGQGDGSYTCANLNRYTCTIANGGTVYDLFLVDEIQSCTGAILYHAEATPDHETGISEKIFQVVKDGMRLVVTDDHQSDFAELESYGIHCAGKTGTAQESEERPDHSLFTGYVNLEDPEMVISVLIPFGGGSKNAIPVFIDIVADYYGVSLDR